MKERREIRASDSERAAAVERLRVAHDEGRLSLLEYDERLARAYQAVTYGDLADLFVDLPEHGHAAAHAIAPRPKPAKAPVAERRALPTALRILWTIWFAVVSINLVVWALVSASNGDLEYFWPMWVAGPSGAALFAVSVGVTAIRRGHRNEPHRQLPRDSKS